jgi:hypothetical protein
MQTKSDEISYFSKKWEEFTIFNIDLGNASVPKTVSSFQGFR